MLTSTCAAAESSLSDFAVGDRPAPTVGSEQLVGDLDRERFGEGCELPGAERHVDIEDASHARRSVVASMVGDDHTDHVIERTFCRCYSSTRSIEQM